MSWEGITAIATSTTVVVALGVPLMLWLLTKPKVYLLDASSRGWFYIYKGEEIIGVRFLVSLRLRNCGTENTTITTKFVSSNGLIFHPIEKSLELEGRGTFRDFTLIFDSDNVKKQFLKEGQTLEGILSLEPWGNRRLGFGSKTLTAKLNIPENQGERMSQ